MSSSGGSTIAEHRLKVMWVCVSCGHNGADFPDRDQLPKYCRDIIEESCLRVEDSLALLTQRCEHCCSEGEAPMLPVVANGIHEVPNALDAKLLVIKAALAVFWVWQLSGSGGTVHVVSVQNLDTSETRVRVEPLFHWDDIRYWPRVVAASPVEGVLFWPVITLEQLIELRVGAPRHGAVKRSEGRLRVAEWSELGFLEFEWAAGRWSDAVDDVDAGLGSITVLCAQSEEESRFTMWGVHRHDVVRY